MITDIKTKRIILSDMGNPRDKCSLKRTEVSMMIEGTDIVLFEKKENKIILPGAGFTARAHFDLPRNEVTPSYNTALELENTVIEVEPTSLEKVYLFCVGTDGCGAETSQVYEPNYAKWIMPDSLVPFRYTNINSDLSGSLREMYYGRKVFTTEGKIGYYFKAFETDPVMYQQFIDGTFIDGTIYNSNKEDEVETVVALKLKILPEDCRDWFVQTTGINDAIVNTISLCTAWAKVFDGQVYYQDIRPLTKLNFPNEALIDLNKGIDITYNLFY